MRRSAFREVLHLGVGMRPSQYFHVRICGPCLFNDLPRFECLRNGDDQMLGRRKVGRLEDVGGGGVSQKDFGAVPARGFGRFRAVFDHDEGHAGILEPGSDQSTHATVPDQDRVPRQARRLNIVLGVGGWARRRSRAT